MKIRSRLRFCNGLSISARMWWFIHLTKYIGGHSDAMGGSVTVKNHPEVVAQIRDFQHTGGAILSPFDCWLILRGVQTLVPRVRLHCENARHVAEFLSTHTNVTKVRYPGLPNDPGHEIARRQMKDFGGMLSFEVRGGREEAYAVAAALKVIIRATSLGGTHSLIEHRASIEGKTTRAPESLLRLSVGLENAEDIISDLGTGFGGFVRNTSEAARLQCPGGFTYERSKKMRASGLQL